MSKIMQGNAAVTITGKEFAITASGAMALVPPLTKEGDVVCYIKCALVPFVLRRKDETLWKLIGTCYVHGTPDIYMGSDWEHILLE
jgi:hypothetical protein